MRHSVESADGSEAVCRFESDRTHHMAVVVELD